ncbi:hypothetical protein [Nocardioides aestuarii]|uniref:Uncharacterized protein n=1 Tax=Nocardioides aestuarii TaxID=252231 RepID=A0ABW4TS53_9ACTN
MRKKKRTRGPAHWLAAAVGLWVMALGLVVGGMTTSASAAETCPKANGWTKYDSPSGSASGTWGSASWANGDTAVDYTVNAGWTLQICIKAATETHFSGQIPGAAHGSFSTGDKHAISHVSLKWTESGGEQPDEIPLPEPEVLDPCGAYNAEWVVPEDTETLDWTLRDDKHLVVEILTPDTVFAETGETTHDYGKAKETNKEECDSTVEVPLPEPEVLDPCNPGNAQWILPEDTDVFGWELLEDGTLQVSILTEDTVFAETGETTHNFGQAPETNIEECEVAGQQLEIPAAPGVKDPCDSGNARWIVPADTDELTWTLEEDGDLVVEITVPDTVFSGTQDTTYNFGPVVETNTDACVKGEQETKPDQEQPTVEVKGQQATVPSAVDAGLPGADAVGGSGAAGLLYAAAAGLLLLGLTCFGRWVGSFGTAARR